jgi:hypothetical protein
MPIDADHATAAVAAAIAVTATDTGSPAGTPAFDSASQTWVDRPPDSGGSPVRLYTVKTYKYRDSV